VASLAHGRTPGRRVKRPRKSAARCPGSGSRPELRDIAGTYAAAGAGGALAGGAGGVHLQNANGVILQLCGPKIGWEVSANLASVTITMN